MIKLTAATSEMQLHQIEDLAKIIWTEHYTPIIGSAQVTYMLEKFQSVKTMQQQLTEGYEYYLVFKNETEVGYFSIQKRKETMFLSKLYVLKSLRGKGIGKAAMDFIFNYAKQLKCTKIQLTVNKNNNNSISTYEHLGFKNTAAIVQDIGGGFVMDDYVLEKTL